MKILHYVGAFSLPSETFIYDLITNLEDNRLDNYILTHSRHLEEERPFKKIKVVNENVSFIKKAYHKFFKPWSIRNFKEVLKYIDEVKPDIIHAHFGPNGIKIFKLIKEFDLKIPLVVSFHGMDINVLPKQNDNYLIELLKMSSNKNISLTSPSEFLKNKMVELGIEDTKINIVPNAYNDIFSNIKKTRKWKYGDEFRILHVGRFEEVKGQIYLIKAFSKIVDIYPNSKLTLIGYGSLEKELKKLCQELKLSKKVLFLTRIEHSKIADIMIEHDIYIQPSIIASDGAEESLGVATIEAQVCGLPCIVSGIGGLKEIVIDNVTGKLSNEKDVDSIVQNIMYYINNSNRLLEHSLKAKREAEKRFNKKILITNITKVYKEVI